MTNVSVANVRVANVRVTNVRVTNVRVTNVRVANVRVTNVGVANETNCKEGPQTITAKNFPARSEEIHVNCCSGCPIFGPRFIKLNSRI